MGNQPRFLETENRFKSGGIGASEIDYSVYTQIDGFFQSKFRILGTGDLLR
jgi:hypothetical protein